MRIAVIGDDDTFTGFGIIGIKDLYAVPAERTAVEDVFKTVLKDSNIGIIVISHSYADLIRDHIKRVNINKKIIPIIVEVPDKGATVEFDPFEELIKKAVGVNI
ncbi:V-type ATP synthase subunit F [archaeon]|nr:MAG: V-type ATP synthase subunit F [archaeon]